MFFRCFMKEYVTVEREASAEFIERKSRFIGYVKPVSTQDEATAFISEIKSKHWDATHNVSAYVLKENNIQRCSDDGEPSGTAGVPVLDVLLKSNVVNACVVVTRYFGGVLLGAGGLVRAYSHGSKIALEAGNIITMAPCSILSVNVSYGFYDKLCNILKDFNCNISDTVFSENVSVVFSIKADVEELFCEKLFDASNGMYSAQKIGEKFAKI